MSDEYVKYVKKILELKEFNSNVDENPIQNVEEEPKDKDLSLNFRNEDIRKVVSNSNMYKTFLISLGTHLLDTMRKTGAFAELKPYPNYNKTEAVKRASLLLNRVLDDALGLENAPEEDSDQPEKKFSGGFGKLPQGKPWDSSPVEEK